MSNKNKKHSTENKEVIYVEKKVLKYFKDRIGDKYREEIKKENWILNNMRNEVNKREFVSKKEHRERTLSKGK